MRAGVEATDEAAGRRYEVAVFGPRGCRVEIARDAIDDVLHVGVEPPKRSQQREVGLALEIFGFYLASRAARHPRAGT